MFPRVQCFPWEEIRSMTKVEWKETNKRATPGVAVSGCSGDRPRKAPCSQFPETVRRVLREADGYFHRTGVFGVWQDSRFVFFITPISPLCGIPFFCARQQMPKTISKQLFQKNHDEIILEHDRMQPLHCITPVSAPKQTPAPAPPAPRGY